MKKEINGSPFIKYYFTILFGCLFLLAAVFIQEIQHQKRIDDIFKEYNLKMDALDKSL